ncbi:MAG: hypothetical protein U0805_11270 [Pirellulales bacterium]
MLNPICVLSNTFCEVTPLPPPEGSQATIARLPEVGAAGIAFGLFVSATVGSMYRASTNVPISPATELPTVWPTGFGGAQAVMNPVLFERAGVEGRMPKSRPLLFVSRPSTKRPTLVVVLPVRSGPVPALLK